MTTNSKKKNQILGHHGSVDKILFNYQKVVKGFFSSWQRNRQTKPMQKVLEGDWSQTFAEIVIQNSDPENSFREISIKTPVNNNVCKHIR